MLGQANFFFMTFVRFRDVNSLCLNDYMDNQNAICLTGEGDAVSLNEGNLITYLLEQIILL